MNQVLFRRAVSVTAIILCLALTSSAQSILSLNNSLIDFNNQPEIFNSIAKRYGDSAHWNARTLLGRSLLFHYNNMLSRSEALSDIYDIVILQEQSSLPRQHPEILMQSVILWKDAIRQSRGEKCPRIIVPMNWPYCDNWEDFGNQAEKLKRAYLDVEREVPGVTVCPVGMAVIMIHDELGEQACKELYTDRLHPSLKASYLAACMEWAVIKGVDPKEVEFVPEGLSLQEAKQMREYASKAMEAWKRLSMKSR